MASASRKYPRRFHLTIGLVSAALMTLGLGWFIASHFGWLAWVACWLVSISLITFLYYGYDKRQAQRAGPRVPEAVLHTLAGVGGTPGALLGMSIFRHKTIKGKFRILFWCIVALQVALGAWIIHYAVA